MSQRPNDEMVPIPLPLSRLLFVRYAHENSNRFLESLSTSPGDTICPPSVLRVGLHAYVYSKATHCSYEPSNQVRIQGYEPSTGSFVQV